MATTQPYGGLDALKNLYEQQTGRQMPGQLWDSLNHGADMATKENLWNTLQSGSSSWLATAAADPNAATTLESQGLVTATDVGNYQAKQTLASGSPTATSATDIALPSELTTLEDWSNKALSNPTPQFSSALVAEEQQVLAPETANEKQNLEANSANAFASLFPEGGGSTYEANNLATGLENIDATTLSEANTFAQAQLNTAQATDQANKSSAENNLSGIATYKANQANFETSTDASNYWNEIASSLGETNLFEGQNYQTAANNANASLATTLANEESNANSNPWLNILNSIASGAGNALGKAGTTAAVAAL